MSDDVDLKKQLEAALESIKNLEETNKKLVEEKRKKVSEVNDFAEKLKELQEFKEQQENIKAEQEGDYKKQMENLKKTYDKKLIDLESKYNEESAYTNRLLVDNNLQEALTKAGVKPELLNGAMALLKPKVKVINEEGERKPMVEDKTIHDFITSWVESDGKAYRHIPQSIGGGAIGSQSTVRHPLSFNDKNFNLTEAMKSDQKII